MLKLCRKGGIMVRNNVFYMESKRKESDPKPMITPAQRLLLESAQKEIDRLRARIKQLEQELDKRNCKCCLTEIIEESVLDGICQNCFEHATPYMIKGFSSFPDCSICGEPSDDGGWLDNQNYRFWTCIDCDDWLDILPQPKKNKNNQMDI